jgi:hypothetical protein
MDMTTMLGLALLALGGYWAVNSKKPATDPETQLADLISQLKPQKPTDVLLNPGEPSVAKVERDEAVDAVEVLVDYFEQRGVTEATAPLQTIIQLIFTPTPKAQRVAIPERIS